MLEMKELNEKSKKELEQMVEKLKEQLFVLRFEKATGQISDPHKFREIKKDIARVFTAMKMVENSEPVKKGKGSSKKQDKKVETPKPIEQKVELKTEVKVEEKVEVKEEATGVDK